MGYCEGVEWEGIMNLCCEMGCGTVEEEIEVCGWCDNMKMCCGVEWKWSGCYCEGEIIPQINMEDF